MCLYEASYSNSAVKPMNSGRQVVFVYEHHQSYF
jgi:hypothetical protein